MKINLSTLLALTPAAVAALSPISVQAGQNYFLKLDGIPGESIDKAHKEWVEIQSWSFGVTAESSWTKGGGASVGKPNPGPFAMTANLSKVSPTLYSYITQGNAIPSVTLAVAKTTGNGTTTDFYTIKLEGVFLTGAKTGGSSSDGGQPTESFTMVFKTATWSYATIDAKGVVGKPTAFMWDVPAGTVVKP